MKNKLIKFIWWIPLAFALFAIPVVETGCKTNIAQGIYNPSGTNANVIAYKSDVAVVAAKNVIQGFLKFEYENRAVLKTALPDATKYADQLRLKAPPALQAAASASKAYLDNPSAANKSAFDQAMAILDPLVSAAQGYFANSLKLR